MKVDVKKLYYRCPILLSITYLIAQYLPFINRMVVGVMMVCYLILALKRRVRIREFLLIFAVTFTIVCAIILTQNLTAEGYERGIYYFLMILFFYRSFTQADEFREYLKSDVAFINRVCYVWSGLVGISIFVPSCYRAIDGDHGWGTSKYFFSWTLEGAMRLTNIAMMAIAIETFLLIVTSQKKYFYLMVIPLYCILMSGNRGFILLGLAEFVIAYYFYIGNKKKFYRTLIPFAVVMGALIFFSAFGDKMQATMRTPTVLSLGDTITNGRVTPILKCWEYFWDSPWWNRIWGNGYGFIEAVIRTWSFNDIIDILITYGLVGVVCYVVAISKMTKTLAKTKIPKMLKLLFFGGYFVAAMSSLFYRAALGFMTVPFCIIIYSLGRDKVLNRTSEEK